MKKDKRGGERRAKPRYAVSGLEFRGLTSIDHMTQVARHGHIVNVSQTGILLVIEREDLASKNLRQTLSLSEIEGDRVYVTINGMDLEIGGKIARTRRIAKDTYEIAIDYSDDAPDYWRDCLLEMMPIDREPQKAEEA